VRRPRRPAKLPRPAGLRWYGVTCYAYGSRTPWTVQGCSEEYTRHRDWDTVIVPASPDVCAAGRCDATAWGHLAAAQGRGLAPEDLPALLVTATFSNDDCANPRIRSATLSDRSREWFSLSHRGESERARPRLC